MRMRQKPALCIIRRNTCMWPYLIIPTGSRPGSIPLSDLDIALGDFDTVKELWSGETVVVDGEELLTRCRQKM